MAKARTKPARTPRPIEFVLTPKQKAELKKRGLANDKAVLDVRVKFQGGKLFILRHKKGSRFVPSNSAFA